MTVSEAVYHKEVLKRRDRCRQIIKDWNHMPYNGRPVSLVVLSCKRPKELDRLLTSLQSFSPMDRLLCETIFVDNGSGLDVEHVAKPTYKRKNFSFDHFRWNRINFGMGPAINAVLQNVQGEFVLFAEDDLVFDWQGPFLWKLMSIFREYPEVGHIRLKNKKDWDTMYPYRRLGPVQETSTGVKFQPWLPHGIHNGWSLGPVLFRWASWSENGALPVAQGRGQAVAAEDGYATTWNKKWLSVWPTEIRPFVQPETPQSPGFDDAVVR